MRYGSMTILNGIQELVDLGVKKILLFPLYPQFAMATTETISALVKEICSEKFPDLIIEEILPFYNNTDYIEVLSKSIKNNIDLHQIDHLLFSYHGIPERHIRKSDITKSHCKVDGTCCDTPSIAHQFCYSHQCKEVTKLVAEKLKLKNYSTSFQSRLGFDPWLQPYTDRTIERLGKSGTKRMAIVTPAFVSDCLETLEEIAMEGKEIFEEVGGDEFTTIPCLNDNDDWVDLISNWVDNWKDNGKCF
jgi:ferrochelatase